MQTKALFSASLLIAAGMVSGRVLGLLREMLLASRFGAQAEADVAIALLIIPDFIASALIGGAVSAALLPAFASRKPDAALALFWQTLGLSLALFIIIALVMGVAERYVWEWMNPDLLTLPGLRSAYRIVLCSLPLSAATAVITAYLQHRARFTAPAFANAIFNVVVVGVLWSSPNSLDGFAWGIIAAASLRLLAHGVAWIRTVRTRPVIVTQPWQIRSDLLKTYMLTAGSGIFSLLPFYAPYGVVTAAGDSIALFNYAFKLVLLPSLLLQTVVQTVLLPWLIRRRAENQLSYDTIRVLLQLAWLLSVTTGMTLVLASGPIAFACFGYGRMTVENSAQVAHLFALGALAVPAMTMASLWQQLFYAHEKTVPSFWISIVQALLVVPFCWLGYYAAGLEGVMLAFAAVQAIPAVALAGLSTTYGWTSRAWPPASTGVMLAAATATFLVLAVIAQLLFSGPVATMMEAGVIGLLAFIAGMLSCAPLRQAIRMRVWRR